jgi:pyruvate formate lyase activating enzyme
VKIDNIYFQATGGGICFGGGEPGLYAEFIREFRHICDHSWKITIETSLYFDSDKLNYLFNTIDNWIVDVKSLIGSVYHGYTSGSVDVMFHNLNTLKETVGAERILVKIPNIPDFTCEGDVEICAARLRKLGFNKVNIINYINHEQRKR